jgi:hypothetical protein
MEMLRRMLTWANYRNSQRSRIQRNAADAATIQVGYRQVRLSIAIEVPNSHGGWGVTTNIGAHHVRIEGRREYGPGRR